MRLLGEVTVKLILKRERSWAENPLELSYREMHPTAHKGNLQYTCAVANR